MCFEKIGFDEIDGLVNTSWLLSFLLTYMAPGCRYKVMYSHWKHMTAWVARPYRCLPMLIDPLTCDDSFGPDNSCSPLL